MSQVMPVLRDFADDFDPFTALLDLGGEGHITDPWAGLGELMAKGPVHALDLHEYLGAPRHTFIGDMPIYTVLGYDEVSAVLMDAETYLNRVYQKNLGITFGKTVTAMEGPEHSRYRRLFQSAFVPKMLTALRPRFQAVIDRLMAGFERRGSADLVQEFAKHFPFQFIMDLMDMPVEGRDLFHKIAMAQMCVTFDHDHGVLASEYLGEFLSDLIDQRRALKSETDFVSVIANAEVGGETLPQDVVVSFFRQLMNAGGDTSYHGFSNVLTALMTHPDQLEMVRRDRSLIPAAIDEALRWDGPLVAIQRMTAREVELGGVTIPAGAFLHVAIGAANHDPKIWERPLEFDITRPKARHVAFGYGPHVCIGQHLGRMELTMALDSLLDRLPGLRLDPAKPAPVVRGATLRGAASVHVLFDVQTKA